MSFTTTFRFGWFQSKFIFSFNLPLICFKFFGARLTAHPVYIITSNTGNIKYMNRFQDSVVYCENDFVMTCDERQGLHTVWKAREVSADDVSVLQATAKTQQNQVSMKLNFIFVFNLRLIDFVSIVDFDLTNVVF